MKYEELIDFTQRYWRQLSPGLSLCNCPVEDLDHLDQGLRRHILGVKNTSRFF